MASTQYETRDQSVGAFPISPRGPPRTSGFRIKWHALSSSARALLCFYPDERAYEDHWQNNSIVALHSPAWSDVSWSCSRDIDGVHGRSHQVHTEKLAKHEREESGLDKTTTTKLSPTEHEPSSSGAVACVSAPLIKDRDARRHGLASPLCDHAALLHLIGARTRAEKEVATGDTVEALIDAILQIAGTSHPGCAGGATPLGSEARSEQEATNDDPNGQAGAQGGAKKEGSAAGAACWEETDAKRAWEAMKRRVMLVEEYGALPLDDSDAGEADMLLDHGAERASRECRAWRRRCWAEEAMRGHAGQVREESSRRSSTKKRRRHAGCWIRENDVFVRLVREIFLPSCFFPLTNQFFYPFYSTHVECEALEIWPWGQSSEASDWVLLP